MNIQNLLFRYFPQELEAIHLQFDWERVQSYYEFLIEKNSQGGFFSKGDSMQILERHLVESLYSVFKIWEEGLFTSASHVADVGTGPGLPGFLFFCLKDPPKVTLIDSSRRKLGLLETWWKEIHVSAYRRIRISTYPHIDISENEPLDKLRSLGFIYARVEEWEPQRMGQADLVTMRAAVAYPFSVEVVANLVQKNGYFLPFLAREQNWKSVEQRILSHSGFTLERDLNLGALSFLGVRKIKILKKTGIPKHGIPRDWKSIAKEIKGAKWEK